MFQQNIFRLMILGCFLVNSLQAISWPNTKGKSYDPEAVSFVGACEDFKREWNAYHRQYKYQKMQDQIKAYWSQIATPIKDFSVVKFFNSPYVTKIVNGMTIASLFYAMYEAFKAPEPVVYNHGATPAELIGYTAVGCVFGAFAVLVYQKYKDKIAEQKDNEVHEHC